MGERHLNRNLSIRKIRRVIRAERKHCEGHRERYKEDKDGLLLKLCPSRVPTAPKDEGNSNRLNSSERPWSVYRHASEISRRGALTCPQCVLSHDTRVRTGSQVG